MDHKILAAYFKLLFQHFLKKKVFVVSLAIDVYFPLQQWQYRVIKL